MDNPELDLHRELASHLGSRCAKKRCVFYGKMLTAQQEQCARLERIMSVYAERALMTEEEGDDCE